MRSASGRFLSGGSGTRAGWCRTGSRRRGPLPPRLVQQDACRHRRVQRLDVRRRNRSSRAAARKSGAHAVRLAADDQRARRGEVDFTDRRAGSDGERPRRYRRGSAQDAPAPAVSATPCTYGTRNSDPAEARRVLRIVRADGALDEHDTRWRRTPRPRARSRPRCRDPARHRAPRPGRRREELLHLSSPAASPARSTPWLVSVPAMLWNTAVIDYRQPRSRRPAQLPLNAPAPPIPPRDTV